MHAQDGLLNVGTAVATGAVSAGAVGAALRQTRDSLDDRQVPLAGVTAAFIFATQMANFPVAPGITGHLLGGALAAILLGPWLGTLVVTVVVVVQAVGFADGGLTALGYNTLNMAVVTSFGGWAAFRGLRRLLPDNGTGVVAATGLAAGISTVLSAAALSVEWLFGAAAPVPFDTMFGLLVGIHLLIAIGEAVISAMVVGAVLAVRPDLVHGASDLGRAALADRPAIGMRTFAAGALLVAVLFATVVSQLAASGPDGLEAVVAETGAGEQTREHALADGPFADYATVGLDDERASLAVAGGVGTLLTLTVGGGLVLAARDPRGSRASPRGA